MYWIPVHQILKARGLEVCLVNAQHVKNVPGRKTDVSDCQWLQYLHSVGLLRSSFWPARRDLRRSITLETSKQFDPDGRRARPAYAKGSRSSSRLVLLDHFGSDCPIMSSENHLYFCHYACLKALPQSMPGPGCSMQFLAVCEARYG